MPATAGVSRQSDRAERDLAIRIERDSFNLATAVKKLRCEATRFE
jgi:hypothetical protein